MHSTIILEWVCTMKLEKFKEKDNKRRFIVIFTVCCIFLLAGVLLYNSFAVFTEEKEFNVINGQYQDPGDLYFAVYVDGEITNTIPSKDSGYTLDTEKSSCTNGATISWNNESWSALINLSNYSAGNMSRTKCTMYFVEASFCDLNPDAATCTILSLADSSSELVYDGTSDNNLRYIGTDPNNYVSFNKGLWRIIGVMNNIDDGTGKKKTRIKIIKEEPYSSSMAWDTDNTNDWSKSSLQEELNTTYLSSITSPYKEMISDAVWNLGGLSSTSNTTSTFYSAERGDTVYTGRPTTWTGSIGLMYPSDYGYATSGGDIGRDTCLSYNLNDWDSYTDCYTNDWIYYGSMTNWTLTSLSSSSGQSCVISRFATVNTSSANTTWRFFPNIYLTSDVKITGGDGSHDNPFTLSL